MAKQKKIIYIGCFFVAFGLFGCEYGSKSINVEIYASPKEYSCSHVFDNGIFNYELKRRNIVLSKEDCCFRSKTSMKDSVITLFYKEVKLGRTRIDTLLLSETAIPTDSLHPPARALLLINIDKTEQDTVFIFSDMNFRYKSIARRMNKEFVNYFIDPLPIELRENWLDLVPDLFNP